MDPLLNWIELQEEPIVVENLGPHDRVPMVNESPSLKEVSRQMCALLRPLVADTSVASNFANVPRHNGLEAWRQLAEPINEDKELLQKDLLPRVTNPKAAATMDKVSDAVRDWDTDLRLFKKAGGVEPTDHAKRITLIRMLPVEIAAYISMHWEQPEYSTFIALKKFVFKYIKVLQNLKRPTARPTHLVDEQPLPPGAGVEDEENEEHAALLGRLLETEDVEEQVEILAVMRAKGFRAPTRGQGNRKFNRTPGGRVATNTYMPPKGRSDLSCINCGKKGDHRTQDCPLGQQDKSKRPCFNCGKTGHIAKDCPSKRTERRPVKAIMDGEVPAQAPVAMVSTNARPRASVFAIGIAPARHKQQPVHLGDYMVVGKSSNNKQRSNNRFQPLTLDDWQSIQESVESDAVKLASVPSTPKLVTPSSSEVFPQLPGGDRQVQVLVASKTLCDRALRDPAHPWLKHTRVEDTSDPAHPWMKQTRVEDTLPDPTLCYPKLSKSRSGPLGSVTAAADSSVIGVVGSCDVGAVKSDTSSAKSPVGEHISTYGCSVRAVDTPFVDVTLNHTTHTPHIAHTSHSVHTSHTPPCRPTFSTQLSITRIPSCIDTPISRYTRPSVSDGCRCNDEVSAQY